MEVDQLLELVYRDRLVKNLRYAWVEAFLHYFIINKCGHSDYHCLVIVSIHEFVYWFVIWCEHDEVILPALKLWVDCGLRRDWRAAIICSRPWANRRCLFDSYLPEGILKLSLLSRDLWLLASLVVIIAAVLTPLYTQEVIVQHLLLRFSLLSEFDWSLMLHYFVGRLEALTIS